MTCRDLMKTGARVIMACRSPEKVRAVSNSINLLCILLTIYESVWKIKLRKSSGETARALAPTPAVLNPGNTVSFSLGGCHCWIQFSCIQGVPPVYRIRRILRTDRGYPCVQEKEQDKGIPLDIMGTPQTG